MKKAKKGQHMGVRDLADILKLITDCPMTAKQVSEQHKCGLVVLRKILRCMTQCGIAHISGWDKAIRGTPAAIFAGGAGVNAQVPKTTTGEQPMTPWGRGVRTKAPANLVLFASLVKALEEGATISEMVESTGANPATAIRFANHSRRIGLAYIGAWHQNTNGHPARVFMLGCRRDVPKPKPMTLKEKSLRQYYARKEKKRQIRIGLALVGASVFSMGAA